MPNFTDHQRSIRGQLRFLSVLIAALVLATACSSSKTAGSAPVPAKTRVVRETVTVRDPDLDKRVTLLELRLLEKEAQVNDLQSRLEDTRIAVVRAMARAQTLTSRAEAASGMAEAEVALQSLKLNTVQLPPPAPPEVGQVTQLVRQSSVEFDRKNYGGALYLANQAKLIVASYKLRVAASSLEAPRSGETSFALPIRVKVASRGNIREGPGTSFGIAFAVEGGTLLTGLSYTEDWIRISDDRGRGGWIFRSLVGRP